MNRSSYRFARMPAAWIRRGDLTRFPAGESGMAVTALKLYIAITSAIRQHDFGPDFGRARLTYDEMEEFADVSRAMIAPALKLLQPWIRVERSRSGNLYELIDFKVTHGTWVRLPSQYIIERKALTAFLPRSKTSLAALKTYLYFLERCQRNSNKAAATYNKIQEMTGIRNRADVTRAINILVAGDLVRVASSRDSEFRALSERPSPGHNVYTLLGLGEKVDLDLSDEADVDLS